MLPLILLLWAFPLLASTADFPAHLIITCPADVDLTIQGQRMNLHGTERHFVSPPLPPDQLFTYEVQTVRNGRLVATQQVEIQAGKTTHLAIALDADPIPESPHELPNFGIDLGQLQQSQTTQHAELNGRLIPAESVQTLLCGDPRLPDPRRPQLTIIGTSQQREQALQLLHGPLSDLVADYVVHDYPPDHWAVAHTGFVTTGQPTIYAQAADGSVLFRQDNLDNLRLNLQAVRKPAPTYHPDQDPDHRRTAAFPQSWPEFLPWTCLVLVFWFLWKSKIES
jgi:uncharacterized protein (TIGR03000 family)